MKNTETQRCKFICNANKHNFSKIHINFIMH